MGFCHTYPGGTELEISMLFVDVRGSTKLAEGLSAAEFSRVINRFYKEATSALIKTSAYIDKFAGDEVIGLYFPLFAGKNHAGAAIHAAEEMLRVAKPSAENSGPGRLVVSIRGRGPRAGQAQHGVLRNPTRKYEG